MATQAKETTTKPASSSRIGACKVVLNIEEPKCRNPYCFPAGRSLRTTVRADRLRHQPGSAVIMSVGEIPGEQVEYDGENGVVYIRDRLGFKENLQLRKDLHEQVSRSPSILDPSASGPPRETEEYRLHTDDDRATWLAHLRKMVDAGQAVEVKGTLPSREEINRLGTWIKGEYFGFETKSITKHEKVVDSDD